MGGGAGLLLLLLLGFGACVEAVAVQRVPCDVGCSGGGGGWGRGVGEGFKLGHHQVATLPMQVQAELVTPVPDAWGAERECVCGGGAPSLLTW